MKKVFAMLTALAVSMIPFVLVRFLIHDTGGGIFLLLYVMPLLIFISSLIYGKHYKFDFIYVLLLTGLVLLISVKLFSPNLYIYAIIYGILALAGNSIGSAFHKDAKNSKVGKIILGVAEIILAIIMFLFALNIFSIKNQDLEIAENNSYPKNTVQFQITNLGENTLDKVKIATNEEGKCALLTKTITLKKDETKTLWIDFSQGESLNCNLASEGNYILSYEKKGTKNSYGFGYFTNYMPTDPFFTLIIDQNGDIKIKAKNLLEKMEENFMDKKISEDIVTVYDSNNNKIRDFTDKKNIKYFSKLVGESTENIDEKNAITLFKAVPKDAIISFKYDFTHKRKNGKTTTVSFYVYENYPYITLQGTPIGTLTWELSKEDYKKLQNPNQEITITKGTTDKNRPVVVGKLTLDKDAKYNISHSGEGDIIDYAVQYDAGTYQGEESLTFSNKKANEVRNKIDRKNNPFYQDWKHTESDNKTGKYTLSTKETSDGYIKYIVQNDNEKIYTSTKTTFITQEPLKNFVEDKYTWWLLYDENQRPKNPLLSHINYHSRLIHNGEEVKNAEAFALHNIDSKVLYFFKKDKNSKIQYYFDGKVYDTNFDEIIHDRCCEYGAYNMRISTDGRLAFWGVIGKQFTYNEMLLPGSTIDIEALSKNKEKSEGTTEKRNPKEVLQEEIIKELQKQGFEFSEIIEGKTSPKEDIEIEKSYITTAQAISESKFSTNDNFFIQNDWTPFKELSWDASGVCSWQRVYKKQGTACLVKLQSLDCKKGNLWIACWDEDKNNILPNNEITLNTKRTARELLEKEILSDTYLASYKPEIKKSNFKTDIFSKNHQTQEIKNAYKVNIENIIRQEFSPEKNNFSLNNWKEIKQYTDTSHSKSTLEKDFYWRKVYQKGNTTCLVKMQEKADASQCYDPKADCIPEADLEIICWD